LLEQSNRVTPVEVTTPKPAKLVILLPPQLNPPGPKEVIPFPSNVVNPQPDTS
jgi:hypothetical protein